MGGLRIQAAKQRELRRPPPTRAPTSANSRRMVQTPGILNFRRELAQTLNFKDKSILQHQIFVKALASASPFKDNVFDRLHGLFWACPGFVEGCRLGIRVCGRMAFCSPVWCHSFVRPAEPCSVPARTKMRASRAAAVKDGPTWGTWGAPGGTGGPPGVLDARRCAAIGRCARKSKHAGWLFRAARCEAAPRVRAANAGDHLPDPHIISAQQ
jgi:hypothetical protein